MIHRFLRLLTLIFLVSILLISTAPPLSANYSLGNHTGSSPYRKNDVEPHHVAGPQTYIWPGAGLSMYQDRGQPHTPGYQSPTTSPLLRENQYEPWGAILTSTEDHPNIGDLIFAVNFTKHPDWLYTDYTYNDILIYLPPEFTYTVNDRSCITTTLTNHYGDITFGTADSKDPFAPNWHYLKINGDLDFHVRNDYREWYYIRINGVIAPQIAGRYFFKIFLDQSFPTRSGPQNATVPMENYPVLLVKGEVDPGIITGTVHYGTWNNTLYGQPIHLPGRVRAVGFAVDPSTGHPTLRKVEARGYFNASSHGYFEVEGLAPGIYDLFASAAGLPATLVASSLRVHRGKSLHIDVYLEPSITVKGRVYSKHGFGEIPWMSQRPIRIELYSTPQRDNVQPLSETTLVTWSPFNQTHTPYTSYVHGDTIWTNGPPPPKRTGFPWEGPPPSKDPQGVYNGVGPPQYWWVDPSGVFTNGGGPSSFIFQFGVDGRYGVPTEFSGHIPQVFASWINGLSPGTYFLRAWVNGYLQTGIDGAFAEYSFTVTEEKWPGDIDIPMDLQAGSLITKTVHFHDLPGSIEPNKIGGPDPGRYLIAEARDKNGIRIAFNFTYVGNTNSSAELILNGFGMAGPNIYPTNGGNGDFGMRYFLYRYRGIRDYGIPPGTYTIYVYMRGYIQQEFEKTTVSLSTGKTVISNHMYRGAGLNVTLYSIDWQKPHIFRHWIWHDKDVNIRVYDETGASLGSIKYWTGTSWTTPKQTQDSSSIPHPEWNPAYSKLKFNGSLSLETTGPAAALPKSPLFPVALKCSGWTPYLESGFVKSEGLYKRPNLRSKVSLETGIYTLKAFTYGYIQHDESKVYARKGGQADIKLKLTIGLNFTITIIFKTESIITPIPYDMSARIRIYDDDDKLIAASTTTKPTLKFHHANGVLSNHPSYTGEEAEHIPAGTKTLTWFTAGLDGYSDIVRVSNSTYGVNGAPYYNGDWKVEVGFVNWYQPGIWYPPPPALLMGEYNLDAASFPYNYLGPYEQRNIITIPNTHLLGESSIVFEVDRRGLIRGVVSAFTWCNELRTVSWATVHATGETDEYTVYTCDGLYEAYLPLGPYDITVYEWSSNGEGHASQQLPIVVSDGQETGDINYYLESSSTPIPEFNATITLLIVLSTVALYLTYVRVRRRSHLDRKHMQEV